MTRTAMTIRPEQQEALMAISAQTGTPMTELVRRAIDAYLKTHKPKPKPLPGQGELPFAREYIT